MNSRSPNKVLYFWLPLKILASSGEDASSKATSLTMQVHVSGSFARGLGVAIIKADTSHDKAFSSGLRHFDRCRSNQVYHRTLSYEK